MLNFKMFASAAAALALSAAPAMAQCAKTHTVAAAQAAGFQTIGYHAATNAAKPAKVAKGNIIDVAVGAGSFNTLAAALTAAGLVDTLKTTGPFTVFAPTDAAFAKLPAGTVEALLRAENRAQLISILTYHVVPGKITSNQLLDTVTPATTVQGRQATIDGRNGRVTVNGVAVIAADVAASNGVIHVIDTVLMPPSPKHH
jgi:uncharacterized surface protein with fasciclin (FAS1) repeats